MTKTVNATQQSLRLLGLSLAGISAFFIILRLLLTYVLGSPGMVTAAVVSVISVLWAAQRSQHARARSEQEALLMQHRAFAAEVERAWERSHSNDLERRKAPHREVPSSHAPAPGVRAVGETAEGSKKRKKKKRAESEETFIVDDELEAEVVEDLEDFLEHSRLWQTLKKTADELRVSQQRKDKKASGALEADAKKAPEPKVPPAKAKKDEEHAPKMGGGKGNGRRKSGEEKSHTKEKEEQQWYGDNSWSSQQDSWDDWGNSRWWGQRGNGQAGGWNGRRERRRPAGRGTSGWS